MKTTEIEIRIVNAFTLAGSGGNPAAVVLDADVLTADQKQQIAKAAGLSETAFVSASDIADFKLEFFTPNRQIAHCGHATIATFAYLAEIGRVAGNRSSKETIDGRREIHLQDGRAFMEQRAPNYEAITDKELLQEVLPALGLPEGALHRTLRPEFVNTGNTFLVIPLHDRECLANITPDHAAIERISERHDLIGFYPFAIMAGGEHHAEARMFAPRYGIPEEAATGMAAGPLAAFLHDRAIAVLQDTPTQVRVTQGGLMTPPSRSEILVTLETDGEAILRLMAGGAAVVSGNRRVTLQV